MSLFSPESPRERTRIADILRAETTGGLLLIVAAVAAMVWANLDGSGYAHFQHAEFGGGWLRLSASEWAADGLLAVFFFVAGLELKREFVDGDLRDPRRAALPIGAAVAGMVVPALIFTAVAGPGRGWAIPTATDIAFAVAVLAVINTHLPSGLRTFLLTLAVVDDLLAIVVIAVFYSHGIHAVWLAAALVPLALWRLGLVRGLPVGMLLPCAVATWVLVLHSGIHPTVAGILLAFAVPTARTEAYDHAVRPFSAGVAVPVFAFLAAGVSLHGIGGAITEPITVGVALGLVLGKTVGIFGGTWLVATLTHADLDPELSWIDVLGVAVLGGVGFTVSLLIGELAYPQSDTVEHVRLAVVLGSTVAALIAAVILRRRNEAYRRAERDVRLAADG